MGIKAEERMVRIRRDEGERRRGEKMVGERKERRGEKEAGREKRGKGG